MKSIFSNILIVSVLCILFFAPQSRAEKITDANISDFLITTSKTHLLLFCSIKNSFTPEMMEGVRNGIPVTFTFLVELEKIKKNWPDTTLVEQTIQHTLSYDPLREEYHILLPERNNNLVSTKSIDKAKEVMAELSGIKIIDRSELIPDAPYALHVKAKLTEKTLPLNMHYIVPFISLWDFETDWRTIEFRY